MSTHIHSREYVFLRAHKHMLPFFYVWSFTSRLFIYTQNKGRFHMWFMFVQGVYFSEVTMTAVLLPTVFVLRVHI